LIESTNYIECFATVAAAISLDSCKKQFNHFHQMTCSTKTCKWSAFLVMIALRTFVASKLSIQQSNLNAVLNFFSMIYFLVACTRLYKPLCRSVGRSVGRSVRRCSRSTRLMAIGLVFSKKNFQCKWDFKLVLGKF